MRDRRVVNEYLTGNEDGDAAVTTVLRLGGGIATADMPRPMIPIEPIADGGPKEKT